MRILTKDPINVLRSIMNSDESFCYDPPHVTSYKSEVRNGTMYRKAHQEIMEIDVEGCLIGIMLAIDDTPLTQHSGKHNGRPVYISTANQSLYSRRQRQTRAWRILALLPVLSLDEEKMTKLEKKWSVHAKVEFHNRVLQKVLQPLSGMDFSMRLNISMRMI